MYSTFNRPLKLIPLSLFVLLGIAIGYMDSHAKEASLAKATFYVY